MTGVDYVILMIVVLSSVVGFKQGFIRGFFPLLSLATAIVIAFFSFSPLSTWLILWWLPVQSELSIFGYSFSTDNLVRFAFFTTIFFIVIILGSVLTSFLYRLVKGSILSSLDRVFGLLFGIVRAFLIVAVIMLFARVADLSDYHWWRHSAFIPKLEAALLYGEQFLPPKYREKFNDFSPLPEEEKLEL